MTKIPWNIEANNIQMNDLDTSNLDDLILNTNEISEFLKSSNYKKMFLVAPKGHGKTLILKVKSQIFRNENSSFKFIPEDRLTERFDKISLSLSKEDFNKFQRVDQWDKTWELCILCRILIRFGIDLPPEIVNHIGYASDLSEILVGFLQNRGSIDKLYKYVNTHLKPMVRKLPDQETNQVAIFIDNIDEGFEKYVGYSLKNPESNSEMLSEKVWINAQNSIIQTARRFSNKYKHIKFFISARSEAFNNIKDSTKLQLDDSCTFLKYDKEDIKKIFLLNIKATSPEFLAKSNNPTARLTGFSEIVHKYVEDENGEKKREDVFSFMYRHTYGRPREIVEMGSSIITKYPELEERTQQNIQDIVSRVGSKLFKNLKNEIVPYFEDEIFEEFCKSTKKNVFTFEQAEEVSLEIEKKFLFENALVYFYRLGLVGNVEINHESIMFQRFLSVGQYSLSENSIPKNKYYVLHPTINNEMKKYHENEFYDSNNIIGYDYPFKINERIQQIKHLHFGLDRDSLTIVIPEINRNKSLAIIQNPSAEWSEITKFEKLTVNYPNHNELMKLNIYHDRLSYIKKEKILNRYFVNGEPVLLYTNNNDIIKNLIVHCKIYSFTSFPKDFFDLIDSDNMILEDRYAYLTKRTISLNEITRINKTLSKLKLKCTPTLIDRFHFNTSKIGSDKTLRLEVNVEKYGSLICPARNGLSLQPSKIVIRTRNDDGFKFYRIKQHYLVEGVYQFFKFCKQHSIDICKDNEEPNNLFLLFIRIQALRVLNSGENNTKASSETKLFNELVEFGYLTYTRTLALSKQYHYTGSLTILNSLKSNGFFPSTKDFYKIVTHSNYLQEYEIIVELKKILKIKPLDKELYSVFISYSFKDEIFPQKPLKTTMSEQIEKRDKMIFIASKNSLKSRACHFELGQSREKHKRTWDETIIPIRIDNYIFEIKDHKIPQEFRKKYMKNINFLLENNISDYSDFKENIDYRVFQNRKIVSLINDRLSKK